MIKISKNNVERFRSNIISGPTCWLWDGYINKNGYGSFWLNKKHRYPHRIAYQLWAGEISSKHEIMHSCDVRSCVNPKHLMIGTHLENMRDMSNKNRSVFGTKCPRALLNESAIKKIIELRGDGLTHLRLSKMFNVSRQCITDIFRGRTWKRSAS